MKHLGYLLIILAVAGAMFASNQQLRRKMGNLYMHSQGRSLLNVAAQSGADISKALSAGRAGGLRALVHGFALSRAAEISAAATYICRAMAALCGGHQ